MRVENDTNDPVDYDQTGTGGDDEETVGQTQGNSGHLNANGGNANFSPGGSPPWTVTFVDDNSGARCTSPSFSNASATVTITSFSPCNIDVS